MTRHDTERRIHDHLSEHGPATLDEIGAWAAKEGLTKAKNPVSYVKDKISYNPRFVCDDRGRWTTLARALDGRWFTHRVRPDEIAAEALSDELDLGPICRAVGMERTYGYPWGPKDEVLALRSTLSGPFQWLPALAAGDVVGLCFDQGRLDVERVTNPVRTIDAARLAQQLRQSLRPPSEFDNRLVSHGVTEQVIAAVTSDPELLRSPTLPLSELVPELSCKAGEHLIGEGTGSDFFVISGDGCWRCMRESTSVIRLELPSADLYAANDAAALHDLSLPALISGVVRGLIDELGSESLDNIPRLRSVGERRRHPRY